MNSVVVDFFVRDPSLPLAPPTPNPPPMGPSDPQVSHAWQDGHERKVQMLRSFLCRDALLAQTTVPSLLLAVFLLPLGAGIYA